MTNYILNWESNEANDQREQILFQQAKELLKVFTIPESVTDYVSARFALLNDLDIRKYVKDALKLNQILRQISARVGYEKEWRLIIFIMRDMDLFGSGRDTHLVKLLSHVMHYTDPMARTQPLEESCYLTCEKPENIWLVTLRNQSDSDAKPVCFCFSQRPDETRYSLYPPNCRFLQYSLDYQQENYFSRALLELHCGIQSLARNSLPSDLLQGNSVYSLKVELDETALCDSVEQYDRWLQRVAWAIQQQDWHLLIDTLSPASAPIIDSISESMSTVQDADLVEKDSEDALKELKAKVDDILEKDGLLERRLLQNGIERLQLWESEQGHQAMSANAEKQCRKDMENQEQRMLQPETEDTKKNLSIIPIISKMCDYIFNFRGALQLIPKKAETEEQSILELEQEYRYAAEIEQTMGKKRLKKMVQVMRTMTLLVLFVLAAMARTGAAPDWKKIIIFLGISFSGVVVTYFSFEVCYIFRRKRLFRGIMDAQNERIRQSRMYFNKMRKYLRLSWVLNYHNQQKSEVEDKRAVLQQRKRELEQFKNVCAQLKICCIGMQGSGKSLEVGGSIQRMLAENSTAELFGMRGDLPEFTLNGNRFTGAFPFIKAIYLKKVIARQGQDVPETDVVREE